MDELPRRARERLAREEAIVAAAEKVFLEKGFEEASMDEIAKEAEFTKRTLYQYFPSKESLFFAVVLRGFRKLAACLEEAGKAAKDGFHKVRDTFLAYCAFCREHPDTFKLISRWGYVKRRAAEADGSLVDLQVFNRRMLEGLTGLLREGMADGSIRSDLPVEATAYSLVFLVTGFLAQLSVTGESFTGQYGLDLETFCSYSIDMTLATLAPSLGKGDRR